MNTQGPIQSPRWSPWFVVLSVAVLSLVCMLCVRNFVRSGPSKTTGIISNLRQIEGAKEQWGVDHKRTGAVVVTKEDLAPYLRNPRSSYGWVKPVAGESYRFGTLAKPPEAQLTRQVDGRPRGTVIRLGSTNIEIIGPSKGSRE